MAENKRYLLAWLDSNSVIDSDSLRPVRRAIEDQVTESRDEVEIDVWLESPGGDAHAAFKLALILRSVAATVRIIVPDYAKSAATLLALAGNDIYMAPGAELGPLDAQMPEEGSLKGAISALNIASAADDVARNAVAIALRGGADVLRLTGLSRADTMDVMFRFSASFSEPLVRQLDPRVVHDAKQMLNVTVRYAERLLTMTDCKDAPRIAKAMVENFPTHGFVIDLDAAERLGLPVRPLADYEYLLAARRLHRLAEAEDDSDTGLIEFGPIDDFLPESEETGGEEKNAQQPDFAGVEEGAPDSDGAKAATEAR